MRLFHHIMLCWLSFSVPLSAQDFTLWGMVPSIQFSGGLNGETDYFLQTGSEIYGLETEEGTAQPEFLVRHLDFSGGLSRDLGTSWNFATSLLLRRRRPFTGQPGWELRPFAQVTHIHRWRKYRLRNRVRSEQRFVKSKGDEDWKFDLRLRYRISIDFPLQGERLDDQEFYLNTSAAILLTLTAEDAWFYRNPRAYTGLGYQVNEKSKLEGGFEFRTQNDNGSGSDAHIFFLRFNWVRAI